MDFELGDEQRAILEAVQTLLARRAGAKRAIELARKTEYDFELEEALISAGFAELMNGGETGPLEAVLVVEACAAAAGTVASMASLLVVPAVLRHEPSTPVALASGDVAAPIRFAAQARTVLVDRGEEAELMALDAGDAMPVPSNFGYPMGRLKSVRGEGLGIGSGSKLRRWWRLGIAAEAVGTMQSALQCTLDYLKTRKQFGRAIGSFQTVQHRLADCHVLVEGSRWLTYEAAWLGAPEEAVAAAAAQSMLAASQVFNETHQLSGAIGYTREHDLHVWSMRLQALRLELGGVSAHHLALSKARWQAGAIS